MKLRVQGSSKKGYEVVNSETGEHIRGVTSVSMRLAAIGGHELIVHVCDFDVDVEMDGEVSRREDNARTTGDD